MRWVLAIADDLTGALETGAKFSGHGIASIVTTELDVRGEPATTVLVVDTETRHLRADEAAAVVRDVASRAKRFDPWLIYKKTDSTLRGHIAAELRALLEVFPERELVYAPAYPDVGRTVRAGQLLVFGVPVHLTEFASDPLNPILHSDIAVHLDGVRATVFEGDSNEDVMAAARGVVEVETPHLSAGPAALAEALARSIPLNRVAARVWPSLRRCLVINGSLHPQSATQISFAQAQGCFENGWQLFEADVTGYGMDRALRIGEIVRDRIAKTSFDALIVFGGDTAFGIHRATGSIPFEPYGEILPGVTLSRAGGMYWIAKAGGFGPREILCDIRRRLT